MKQNLAKLILLLFFFSGILFLSSCVSTKIGVNTPFTNGIPVDTLNMTAYMIGPLWQPTFPLLDAAAFNEKTNGIADQIMDAEQQRLEDFKQLLVDKLQTRTNTKIWTGGELDSEKADRYRVTAGIQVDHKNFPIVFFSEGDLNALDLDNGKNIANIFKNNETIKNNLTWFASDMGIKNVLISYNRLSVISVGMFGTSGNLRLESYLYLYNSRGELLAEAYGWTKPTPIRGRELSEYLNVLDEYDMLTDLLTEELAKYLK